jgi:hypothetical protein
MNIKSGSEQSIIYEHMKRVDILAKIKDILICFKYVCKRKEELEIIF